MSYDKRKVEVYKNNEFVECEMKDLKIGDIFKLFEFPDFKELVDDGEGNTLFEVVDKPFINENGIWTVNTQSAV